MQTDYTNIKHFTFGSVKKCTLVHKEDDQLSLMIMEDDHNGIEIIFYKDTFIHSLIPFFSELNDSEKEVIKNYLSESWDMLKSLIIYFGAYSIMGMFLYFSISDSLLKSQQIHCNNGSQIACSYLKN